MAGQVKGRAAESHWLECRAAEVGRRSVTLPF